MLNQVQHYENSLKPFVIRVKLYPDESLSSFLIRLLEANYCDMSLFNSVYNERLSVFDEAGFKPPFHPNSTGSFEALASLTGFSPLALINATFHRFAPRLNPIHHGNRRVIQFADTSEIELLDRGLIKRIICNEKNVRFCPLCVKDIPYHRLEWSFSLISYCSKHRCYLTEGCPVCRSPLSIFNIIQERCSLCGCDITSFDPIPFSADPYASFCQDILRSWLGFKTSQYNVEKWHLPSQPSRILFGFIVDLCYFFMMFSDDPFIQIPGSLLNQTKRNNYRRIQEWNPIAASFLINAVFKTIIEWPKGFLELLNHFSSQSSREFPYNSSLGLGYIYWKLIENKWNYPEYEFIQEEFDNFIINIGTFPSKFIETSNRCESRPRLAERLEYISLQRAAELLQVDNKSIRTLVRRGEIKQYYTGGETIWLKQKDVLKISSRWKIEGRHLPKSPQFILLSAHLAGITAEKNIEMRENLNSDYQPMKLPKDIYQKTDGEYYELSDTSDQPPGGAIYVRALDFLGAVDYLSNLDITARDFITYIASNRIKAFNYVSDYFKDGLLAFFEDDLDKIIDEVMEERGWLDTKTVAYRLHRENTFVDKIEKLGLLQPIRTIGGKKYYRISDVENFLSNYIFAAEAIKILKIKKHVFYRLVEKGILQAVSGFGPGSSNPYLLKRSEINSLNVNCYISM